MVQFTQEEKDHIRQCVGELAAYHITTPALQKLLQAIAANSPVLEDRLNHAMRSIEVPQDDRREPVKRIITQMWRGLDPFQKRGPDKQFPYRKEMRYDEEIKLALDALTSSEEDASSLIRRLIREEHARRTA